MALVGPTGGRHTATRTLPVLLLVAVLLTGCGATKTATSATKAKVTDTTSTTFGRVTTTTTPGTTNTTAAVVGVLMVVHGQQERTVRPESLNLTLNDPSDAMHLHWTSWGLTSAVAEGTLTWACCLDKGGSDPATFTLEDPVAWRDQLVFDKVIVAVHAKGQQPYTETLPEMTPPVTVPATTLAPAEAAPATTAPPSVGYGYLTASESEVAFLQFTKGPGGELTGSFYDDSLSGPPPNESVQNDTVSFSGSLAGSQLTLSFDGESAPVFGQLSGSTVNLEVPQGDGSLAEETLVKATPAQYDTALSALQQQANSDNQSVIAPTNPSIVCSQECPTLPAVPNGYYSVGVFSPEDPSDMVSFAHNPLQVCFAVSSSITSLGYEIGSPSGGPTTLYQGSPPTSGCVSDPGNDSDLTNVAITASGSGMWLVQIDEATDTEVSALQQQAAAEQAVDQAAQTVSGDESTVAGDVSTLTSDEQTLASDVSTIKQDLQTVKGDLAQVQSDMKSERIEACGDAGTVSGDEGSLEGDQGGYQGDLSGEQNDMTILQQDAATLKSDWGNLLAQETNALSYVPSGGLPSESAEAAALASASGELSHYQAAVSADTATIAGLVTQGKAYVAQANQLCSESNG